MLKLLLEDGAERVCDDWDANKDPAHPLYLETNLIVPVFGLYKRYYESNLIIGRTIDMENEFQDIEKGKSFYKKAPVRWVGKDQVLFVGSLQPQPMNPEPIAYPLVVAFDDPRSFAVAIEMPVRETKRIKAISGGFKERGAQEVLGSMTRTVKCAIEP